MTNYHHSFVLVAFLLTKQQHTHSDILHIFFLVVFFFLNSHLIRPRIPCWVLLVRLFWLEKKIKRCFFCSLLCVYQWTYSVDCVQARRDYQQILNINQLFCFVIYQEITCCTHQGNRMKSKITHCHQWLMFIVWKRQNISFKNWSFHCLFILTFIKK